MESPEPSHARNLALYRRYRPETFTEVIGQEHVTAPLRQALANDRVNHAYLFSGPRGCGKTTSARILARALNCEKAPISDPCGECSSCRDLARGGPGSVDVIEIDAASHGGVDDARDLRERAFFAPVSSRYKVYIIDEAHMVSSQGFNALLKLVEEPPEHLKFIFATTEPEKVIATIRSRTHHYPFRLIPPRLLSEYLADICQRENVRIDPAALPLVVRAGGGSARDSLSVLDQLLSGAGPDGVTYDVATSLLGYTPDNLLDDVIDGFAAGDGAAVFGVVDKVIESGQDPRRFTEDVLRRLRDLVIVSAVPDAPATGLVDAPEDAGERLVAQASRFGRADLVRAADTVAAGLTEMRGATTPRLLLELICARVLLPAADLDATGLAARMDRLERRIGMEVAAPASAADAAASASGGTDVPAGNAPRRDDQAGAGASGAGGADTTAAPKPPSPSLRDSEGARPIHGRGGGTGASPDAPAVSDEAAAGAPGGGGAGPDAAPNASGPRDQAGTGTSGAGGAGPDAAPKPPTPSLRDSEGASPIHGRGDRPGATSEEAGAPAPSDGDASPPASAAAAAEPGRSGMGLADVRRLWPDLLDRVKTIRRFTWILLSQNAQVVGFEGDVLTIGMKNAGARDSFVNSGSDDILRRAAADAIGADWRIEAIVDPSTEPEGTPRVTRPSVPRTPPAAPPADSVAPPPDWSGPAPSASAAAAARGNITATRPEPREPDPQADAPPADEHVDRDDPDADVGYDGQALLERELGATVIDEINHDERT